MARRRMAITRSLSSVQHSGSQIDNTGSGSVPETLEFMETQGGARTTSGSEQNITNLRTTGETCNVGDIVKYVNLFIQAGGRDGIETDADRVGWLEYAIVLKRSADASIPITQLGVDTLGTVATRMYVNECIWTGNFPVGVAQPNSVSLQIKIPKTKQKIHLGDVWVLNMFFRSTSSTSTSTAAVRLWSSYMYKSYN